MNLQGVAIPLSSWQIKGEANSFNVVHGSSKDKDINDLSAWIDFFGDISIEKNIAKIILANPPH